MRDLVADGDRRRLLGVVGRPARHARTCRRPVRGPSSLVELRLTDPLYREGVLGPIFMLATDLDVSIVDFEVAHSMEGPEGVLILVVDADRGERFHGGLMAQGYRPSLRPWHVDRGVERSVDGLDRQRIRAGGGIGPIHG